MQLQNCLISGRDRAPYLLSFLIGWSKTHQSHKPFVWQSMKAIYKCRFSSSPSDNYLAKQSMPRHIGMLLSKFLDFMKSWASQWIVTQSLILCFCGHSQKNHGENGSIYIFRAEVSQCNSYIFKYSWGQCNINIKHDDNDD